MISILNINATWHSVFITEDYEMLPLSVFWSLHQRFRCEKGKDQIINFVKDRSSLDPSFKRAMQVQSPQKRYAHVCPTYYLFVKQFSFHILCFSYPECVLFLFQSTWSPQSQGCTYHRKIGCEIYKMSWIPPTLSHLFTFGWKVIQT